MRDVLMAERWLRGVVVCCVVLCTAALPGVVYANGQSDQGIANRWLLALKSDDAKGLTEATALPFTFRTTNRLKKCEGVIQSVDALLQWRRCVGKAYGLLLSELVSGSEVQIQDGGAADPKAISSLVKSISTHGVWVRAFLSGDGVTYNLRFLVVGNADTIRRVGSCVLDADFEQE